MQQNYVDWWKALLFDMRILKGMNLYKKKHSVTFYWQKVSPALYIMFIENMIVNSNNTEVETQLSFKNELQLSNILEHTMSKKFKP